MTDNIETAVRMERAACASMLEPEAMVHEAAADECLREEDGDEEAGQHIWDAELLRRMAARIRARNNPPSIETTMRILGLDDDEIKF